MPDAYNRVVLQGTLAGGEVWSTGMAFGDGGSTPPISLQSDLTAWAEAISDWLNVSTNVPTLRAVISGNASVDRVLTQYFAPNGILTAQGEEAVEAFSGANEATLPYPTSLVFTLQTGIPGASYRGRNYWPLLNFALEDGRLSNTGDAGALAVQFATLCQAITDAGPTVANPVLGVFSRTKGLFTPVSSIRCGDVPDTQRRRRDALVEAYSVVGY